MRASDVIPSIRWLLTIFLLLTFSAEAQTGDIAGRAAALARESCTVSATEGARTREDGKTIVTIPGSREEVTLSEDRWRGIQQVLREHQRDESRNFRDCVRDLTPQFLAALQAELPKVGPETVPGGQCEFENDGVCDVPYSCPQGTDLNDCRAAEALDQLLQQQNTPLYCCDSWGQRRCQITTGIPAVGTPCFCYGVVGTGTQCY